jgi:hypothetical protein
MATWDTTDYGWGSSVKTPNYSGAFDKNKDGAFSNAWKSGFNVKDNNKDFSSVFSSLFDKATQKDKYRQWGERSSDVRFGEPTQGRGAQLLENLSALYPQQQAPLFIPGVEGKKGIGSTIGTALGIGASFIPGVGSGIAPFLPQIGGMAGGFFD